MTNTNAAKAEAISKAHGKVLAARTYHALNDVLVRATADTTPAYRNGSRLLAGGIGRVWAVRDGQAVVRFAAGSIEDTCIADTSALEVV